MKIGLVLQTYPSYSETFFEGQISGLAHLGYNVSLYINSDSRDKKYFPENVNIFVQPNINNRITLLIILLRLVIRHPINTFRFISLEKLSSYSTDIILKHLLINAHILSQKLDWLHFGFATMGIDRENVARAIGAKSAVSFRGFDIGLYPHQHPHCYNLLFKRINKVHTISDDLYRKALELGIDPKIPNVKITPAIDSNIFTSISTKDLHNPLRLLTVGRLVWKKGYEYALKALRLLKDQKINFEYCIVGEGNYRETIKYAIHQLQLTENIILKGELSHEDVKHEMEWADIYIQPSIQEGFCNAVLEAQAMGLLCIVTNAEGLTENIVHGQTGWVVPKRSPEAIAEQTINILNMERHEYNNIRKNAIDRIKYHFKLDDQIKNWTKFYQND